MRKVLHLVRIIDLKTIYKYRMFIINKSIEEKFRGQVLLRDVFISDNLLYLSIYNVIFDSDL